MAAGAGCAAAVGLAGDALHARCTGSSGKVLASILQPAPVGMD